MSTAILDRLIDSEGTLIAALDGDAPDAIEHALAGFADAIEGLRGVAGWRNTPDVVTRVTEALQLAEAARIRTAYLADRNRRQIEQVVTIGQRSAGNAYGRDGRLRA